MTPGEHLAAAEQLLAEVPDPNSGLMVTAPPLAVYAAIGHALIALAAEQGVPHGQQQAGGGGSATAGA